MDEEREVNTSIKGRKKEGRRPGEKRKEESPEKKGRKNGEKVRRLGLIPRSQTF